MSYLYRCTKKSCGQRRALKHEHTWYIRDPKCKACGSLLTYCDVWQMKKNRDPNNLCYCDGIHFTPHRKGSTVWCDEHPTGPTEQDFEERYGKGEKYE